MATCNTIQKLEKAFRREVSRRSTHPRQATEWLAEINQANPMQDLQNVGAAFGDYQMSLETLKSKIVKGFVKMTNLEFEQIQGQRISTIRACSKIDDVHGRVMGMNDLFIIKLLSENLKKAR